MTTRHTITFFLLIQNKKKANEQNYFFFPTTFTSAISFVSIKSNPGIYRTSSQIIAYFQLKDNLPHNTYQIYVKPYLKNTQMTLEYQIFDDKAVE